MRRLTVEEVHALKVAELGLDPDAIDLCAPEAIAGALRRAASAVCPSTPATLVRHVVRPLRGLIPDIRAFQEQVEEVLEAMIAIGDLLECADVLTEQDDSRTPLLYPAPASFVGRESGAVLLVGIASDQLSALPADLEARIEYSSHVRQIRPLPGEDLAGDLSEFGLVELREDSWLRLPPSQSPQQLLEASIRLLNEGGHSGDVPGLEILDPSRPVTYYRGRWVEPRGHSGYFVARRNQVFGAKLWSFVHLQNGQPDRLVDLPAQTSRWRGCDDAWHLQLAVDAQSGRPQRYRLETSHSAMTVLQLFSPVPLWARRRWDAIGEPVLSPHCLFAYRIPKAELDEEVRFLQDRLWLTALSQESHPLKEG